MWGVAKILLPVTLKGGSTEPLETLRVCVVIVLSFPRCDRLSISSLVEL